MNPKTRVYYMGRRVDGRFDSLKAKVRRFILTTLRIAILVALMALGVTYGAYRYSTTTVTVIDSPAPDLNALPAKIDSLKAGVVSSIQSCETPGFTENDAPMILDTNKQMSIGLYMFQIKTVQEYEKSLYGKDVTRKQAIEIALDSTQAAALANDIVFKAGGINNWYNCATKLNLSQQVAFIKQLN